MRLFALRDANDPDESVLAVLTYYTHEREFHFDMPAGTDPWSVPLILSTFAVRGEWAVGPQWARRWVESRVVPPNRQNLGEVLKANGLNEYDELALLEMTEGRCCQDECYLAPLEHAAAPPWFAERERLRVVEAIPLEGHRLLVAFRDGAVSVCDMRALGETRPGLERVLEDESVFSQVEVGAGGRCVRWGTHVRIEDVLLRRAGTETALSWNDMRSVVRSALVDAAEASRMLGCSRQNVAALAKRGSLPAVMLSPKCTLFLRADVRDRLG